MKDIGLQLLIGDEYFRLHPDKILGKEEETTDQYGKPVTIVKGSLKDAMSMMPEFPEPVAYDYLPAKLGSKNPNYDEKTIAKAIRATNKNQEAPSSKGLDLLSMEEVIKKFHPNISEDDLRIWVYYQTGRLMSELKIANKKNGWSRYIIKSNSERKKYLKKWLNSGKMAFDGDVYIPSYIYYSGDIYLKIENAEKRKHDIIAEIGEGKYEKQLKKLEKVKPEPLKINHPEGADLHLNPFDDFTQSYTISETTSGDFFNDPTPLLSVFAAWVDRLDSSEFPNGSNRSDVIKVWLNKGSMRGIKDIEKATRKRKAQQDGHDLFERFLKEEITSLDQQIIESKWNRLYNNIAEPDFSKIPVGLEINKYFKNTDLLPRNVSWEGVKFVTQHGAGIIAFDVGVGKTMTSILAMGQALYTGQCKRPLIVVPNGTYKKWIAETIGIYNDDGDVVSHGILPQYKDRVNDYYNLGVNHSHIIENNPPADYTISFMSYEGFAKLGYSPSLRGELEDELYEIMNQGESDRDSATLGERIDRIIGDKEAETSFFIDELGFDYLIVDEAHNFKNIFCEVKGEVVDNESGGGTKRDSREYNLSVNNGLPSLRGISLFFMSQYILRRNNYRNVILLTATPFTNSPLEIYSMLSAVAYHDLKKRGLNNIRDFFDKFIKETFDIKVTHKGNITYDPVIKSFQNRIVLQNVIFNAIIHKTGEEANVPRPKKIVYPLLKDNDGVSLPYDEQVDTALQPTDTQNYWMKDISRFANKQPSEIENYIPAEWYPDPNRPEYLPSRALIAVHLQQSCTLSPYLMRVQNDYILDTENISVQEFVESSPKLQYTMRCIQTAKQWHLKRKEELSGQVIYMKEGVDFFVYLKQYLVENLGFQEKEIGIIGGPVSDKKKQVREMNKFLSGETKILVGSSAIKEGIDLQDRATVLYNLFLDWNPTDVQQVEGRIYRQGNKHSHVRIVTPLLENSADVFLFQKLDEKTSRINDIWYRSGKGNVLDTDSFDPEELKFALMSDVNEAARFKQNEEKELLTSELTIAKDTVKSLYKAKEDTNAHIETEKFLRKMYETEAYPELSNEREELKNKLKLEKDNLSKEDKTKAESRLNALSRALDLEDGKNKEDLEEKRYYRVLKAYARTRLKRNVYDWTAITFKSRIEEHLVRKKRITRIQDDILARFDLTIHDDIEPVIADFEKSHAEISQKLSRVSSKEYFHQLVENIKAEREAQEKYSKPISYRVKQFKKHNHLLSCLKDIHDCKLCPKAVVKKGEKAPKIETKPIEEVEESNLEKALDDLNQLENNLDIKSNADVETQGSLRLKDIPDSVKTFMPEMQQKAIVGSNEHWEVIERLEALIKAIPESYETDGLPNSEKICMLHYFHGQSDWYIIEKDKEKKQLQAFGFVVLNGDWMNAELGYISIDELKETGAIELDFYFQPTPLSEIKAKSDLLDHDEVNTSVDSKDSAEHHIEQINQDIAELKELITIIDDKGNIKVIEKDIEELKELIEILKTAA